jgi:hypothetical protein
MHLKTLLDDFSTSTGLKVNFNQSSMVPIYVTDAKINDLVATFGCTIT